MMARLLLAIMIGLASLVSAHAQSAATAPDIAEILQSGTNLPQLLEQPAVISALADGQVPEAVQLEQQRLRQLMVSMGYLDATIELDIAAPVVDGALAVTARINSGFQYNVGQVHIHVAGITDPDLMSTLDDATLFASGQLARGTLLDEIADRLVWQLGEAGYPFAVVNELTTSPGSTASQIDVIALLTPGHAARFGGVTYDRVPESLMSRVRSIQPFEPGELFSSRSFDQLRAALAEMPNVRRSGVDILPAPGGRFELVIQVRSAGVTGFSQNSTAIGAAILGATLVIIMLGLLLKGGNMLRHPQSALALNLVMLMMTAASLSFVVGRAASLV